MLRTVIIVALFAGVAGGRLGASTSAEARAKVWLKQHESPDEAGLNDLKASDPNSYAIVQALLMKQQAGLLDPSNPAGGKHEEHESAADIMRDAPTIEGAAPSIMSEIAVRAPVQHSNYGQYAPTGNNWAFKPKVSDDDVMSIITGGAPAPSSDAIQPISQMVMSASYTRPSPVANTNSEVLSILSGTSHPTMSAMAYAAPARNDALYIPHRHVAAAYTPPVQQYGGRAASFNPNKGDDDALAIIEGTPVQQPSSSLLSSRRTVSDDSQSSGGNTMYGISLDWGKSAAPAAPAAPVASMSQENARVAPAAPVANFLPVANTGPNPYLEGIDLGGSSMEAPKPAAAMISQNSYMSQISFPHKRGEEPAYSAPSKAANDLTSFSWNEYSDVADGRVQVQRPQVQTQYIQQADQVDESKIERVESRFEESKLKGALSDWLAPMHETPAARKPKAAEPSMPDDPDKIDPMAMDKYNDWANSGVFH